MLPTALCPPNSDPNHSTRTSGRCRYFGWTGSTLLRSQKNQKIVQSNRSYPLLAIRPQIDTRTPGKGHKGFARTQKTILFAEKALSFAQNFFLYSYTWLLFIPTTTLLGLPADPTFLFQLIFFLVPVLPFEAEMAVFSLAFALSDRTLVF